MNKNYTDIAEQFSAQGRTVCVNYIDGKPVALNIHLHTGTAGHDYAAGVELMRELGVKHWRKQIVDNWTAMNAVLDDGVTLTVFTSSLPPTCRLVEVTERIKKTETVDTGEYIEVTRTRVVCPEQKEKELETI